MSYSEAKMTVSLDILKLLIFNVKKVKSNEISFEKNIVFVHSIYVRL